MKETSINFQNLSFRNAANMSILVSLRFRWERKSDHVTFIYMRAYFMLQYLNYWIWISNVILLEKILHIEKKIFNIASQYLDIMDEYLLFEYLLFDIHFSPCTKTDYHTEKLYISISTIVFFNLGKNVSLWEFLLVKVLNFIKMIWNLSINYSKICYELCWSFISLL